MGLWRQIEEILWTGKVVRDYGVISEEIIGGARRRVSAILGLDRDAVTKLDAVLLDSLVQM